MPLPYPSPPRPPPHPLCCPKTFRWHSLSAKSPLKNVNGFSCNQLVSTKKSKFSCESFDHFLTSWWRFPNLGWLKNRIYRYIATGSWQRMVYSFFTISPVLSPYLETVPFFDLESNITTTNPCFIHSWFQDAHPETRSDKIPLEKTTALEIKTSNLPS